MKPYLKLLSLCLLFCFLFTACVTTGSDPSAQPDTNLGEAKDYADLLKLDKTSDTAKLEVKVKSFIDGDTTHFYVSEDVMEGGVLKARYLAINTPESTGKIEEYGKKASAFTKEKLSSAISIIIESETAEWEADSTGSRYLAWVWYKTADSEDYRNLNVEILQNGLALASNTAGNRYGETCMAALNQAKALKLNVYSNEKDPDFYYGAAVGITLKELRTNITEYDGMKVSFEGVVSTNSGNMGVYVEEFDEETGLYYGIYIYYGHGLSGTGLDVLSVGNRVRIIGTVQYYETGGSWQVSDLNYKMMRPDDPDNIQKISSGNAASYVLTEPDTFVNGVVEIQTEDESISMPYAQAVLGTSIQMQGLKVKSVYTTDNEESSSNGAMTLTCEKDGVTVSVRTAVLYDEDGNMITQDIYLGKTIDIKGIVDYFADGYQIKVFTANNITIN